MFRSVEFSLAAFWTDGMQSPPRLKRIVIAPVDEDISVRSSHFHLLYFIFILVAWRTPSNEAVLSGVFLECFNERHLIFIQNNLFKRVLTVTIPQSQIHQILVFLTSAELQDNPVKSFIQALQGLPQKNFNCHCLLPCDVFAVDLYQYLWLRREEVRREVSMYKMHRKFIDWNKCHFWWQRSYIYTVLFLLLLFFIFYITLLWVLEFGFSSRSSLPRTGCYSLKKKRPLKFRCRSIK